jgi:hypothetical protein
MTVLHDHARFRYDEPDGVVTASLVCMLCLRQPISVVLVEGNDESVALCQCVECSSFTEVVLTPEQLLRILRTSRRGFALEIID